MVLHLLLISWHFADISQTSLIILQCVFCIICVSDHYINGFQPGNKRFTLYKKHYTSGKLNSKYSDSQKVSLVQIDGGEAIDVVHLLQCDVQFGVQHRRGAGLLRRRQDLLCLLSDRVQIFFQTLQL